MKKLLLSIGIFLSVLAFIPGKVRAQTYSDPMSYPPPQNPSMYMTTSPVYNPPSNPSPYNPTYSQTPIQTAASVTIQNFQFLPQDITIPTGTTITWFNRDSVPHTTTADINTAEYWNSGVLYPGQSFSKTFTIPGTYTYHCMIHPFMHGVIRVVPRAQRVIKRTVPYQQTYSPPTYSSYTQQTFFQTYVPVQTTQIITSITQTCRRFMSQFSSNTYYQDN